MSASRPAPDAHHAPARRVSQPGDEAERRADAAAAHDAGSAAASPKSAVQAGGPALPGLGAGEALPADIAREFGQRLGTDLSAVRIHRDAAAARGFGADAFALGHHVAFAPGRYDPGGAGGHALLGHELAHVADSGGQGQDVMRHAVGPTDVTRHTRVELLGDGTAAQRGLALEDFEAHTRRQADWFTEPTLSAADRELLWSLLHRALAAGPLLAGAGDLPLGDLAGLGAADWTDLDAFCRACQSGGGTVHIGNRGTYPLVAQRLSLGRTLRGLEALLPADVLEITVGERHLVDIDSRGCLPAIRAYMLTFQPHLEGRHDAPNPEIQRLLDLVTSPLGLLPYMPLLGRVRNLHRFSAQMLGGLMLNFANTRRERPVHLVLHTGHDADAFQNSAPLFQDLVLNSPNLVLMLEGQPSLNSISTAVPVLAATYGQPDATGTPRIAQVMIAGHGSARSVGMAGTGNPHVVNGAVTYNEDSLDLDTNAGPTTTLLDTLFAHMDPAQARLVYAGCLVGSNPVPENVPVAGMGARIAATPSLGTFTEQRAALAGVPAGRVSAARASVGLSAATSLHDGAGNLGIQYAFDQAAFGSARDYVPVGREPEGVLVAAVEVAATDSPVAAEALLRRRLKAPVDVGPNRWWDECTRMLVEMALDGVALGAGIDVARVNALAHEAQIPFLAYFRVLTTAHWVNRVNRRAFAADLYTRTLGTLSFNDATNVTAQEARFVAEQGWLALDAARAGGLLAHVAGSPAMNLDTVTRLLSTAHLAARAPALFPAAAAVTPERIRLALAWLQSDPAQLDVRAFLDGQVLMTPDGPSLSAAVRGELGGLAERDVLQSLGRLAATVPAAPGAPELPAANADLFRNAALRNDIRIEPQVYDATVLPAVLNVRDQPSMNGRPFAWIHRGDVVHVMGFTHGWAAIDQGGRLGFVYNTQITRP